MLLSLNVFNVKTIDIKINSISVFLSLELVRDLLIFIGSIFLGFLSFLSGSF